MYFLYVICGVTRQCIVIPNCVAGQPCSRFRVNHLSADVSVTADRSYWKETSGGGKKRVAKGINMHEVNRCERRSDSKFTWHEKGRSKVAMKAYRWNGLNIPPFLNSTLDGGE